MELKELDTDTELPELFYRLCPSAKEDALDNGVCQMMYGAIALSEGNANYAKTVYLYLNNLYTRWQKPEQALAYKNKYLECFK